MSLEKESDSVSVHLEQAPTTEASFTASCDDVDAGSGATTEVNAKHENEVVENGNSKLETVPEGETVKGLPTAGTARTEIALLVRMRTFIEETSKTSKSHFRGKKWEYAEAALLFVAILTVCCLLTLPTIFYFGVQDEEEDQTAAHVEFSTSCTAEVYTGSFCRNSLKDYQDCLLGPQEHILIPVGANEEEMVAQQFIAGLGSIPQATAECKEAAQPFLCFYMLGLCDNTTGTVRRPSQDHCLDITQNVCKEAFDFVTEVGFGDSVPQCQSLPNTTFDCIDEESGEASGANDTLSDNGLQTLNSDSTAELHCSDGFYMSPQGCRPECGKWEQLPHGISATADALVILSTCIYLVTGMVLLVLSCLRYKIMFSFPSVFIVYQTLTLGLFELFVLIGFTDREQLYCSARDLQESVKDASPYCEAIGIVFHYTSLQAGLWWLFHVTSLFAAVRFPAAYKQWEKKHYLRYLHIVLVLFGLTAPVLAVAIMSGTDGYTLPRFPPFTCSAADPDASYYSLVLVTSVYLAIGVSLMLALFMTLVKLIRKKTEKGNARLIDKLKALLKNRSHQIMRTQIKLFFILSYYIVFGVVGLTSYSAALHAREERTEDLTNYFVCEARGNTNGCSKSDISQLDIESLVIVSFILIGIYPMVNLIYVIQIAELKQKCCWWRYSSHFVSSSGYRSNPSFSVNTPRSTKNDAMRFKFGRNDSSTFGVQSPPARYVRTNSATFAAKSPFTGNDSAVYSHSLS